MEIEIYIDDMDTIPTECPICQSQLNVDDEYMYKHYAEAYPDHLDWSIWTFYCSGDNEHIGTYQDLVNESKNKEAFND